MEPENQAETEHSISTASPPDILPASPESTFPESQDSEQNGPQEPPSAPRLPEGTEPPVAETPEILPASEGEPAAEPVPGTLEFFAQKTRGKRLNTEEETQTITLLAEALLGGRSDVSRALQAILILPWTLTAQGATRAWPEMKPTFRSQLLAGLARAPGEPAIRVRLSLARSLSKIDLAATLKLIILTLKLLIDRKTGLLQGRGAHIFSSVLIGKGKAWLLQLPLESLKPSEVDLLVASAIHGAFHCPQPPPTQIGILRWAAQLDRLSKLPDGLEQLALRSIHRWSGKWHPVLRREVENLPESWTAGLKTVSEEAAPREFHSERRSSRSIPGEGKNENSTGKEDGSLPVEVSRNRPSRHSRDSSFPEDREENETDLEHPSEQRMGRDEDEMEEAGVYAGDSESESADEELDADQPDDLEEEETTSGQTRSRPVYESKTVPKTHKGAFSDSKFSDRNGNPRRPAAFNLHEALRQIEAYAQGLRSDLASAQKQLSRQREDDRKPRRPERPAVVPGEPSVEELNRLNQQLEFRNAELCARIEELTLDSEQRAVSRNLVSDASEKPDPATELKTLLGLKLREDFEDFQALEQEKKDLVVQQHYRSLLKHIFDILIQEGVSFAAPPEGS